MISPLYREIMYILHIATNKGNNVRSCEYTALHQTFPPDLDLIDDFWPNYLHYENNNFPTLLAPFT